ncbi:hypothetical protein [Curtobacterium sp. RRHDQ10]|uniref:hypothetical protein n=1 Tax=Curtobacterium phyllosphaerae TaxID=3413379 RepID=UPI003BEF4E00
MPHDSLTTSRWFIGAGIVVSAAAALLLVAGCSQIRQQTADAWSVTYEVTVDQPAGSALTHVRAEGAERRGDDPEVAELGSVTTVGVGAGDGKRNGNGVGDGGGDGSVWRHETLVLATDRSMVVATPPPGGTASCRILLDGKRVIDEEHADVGAPVTCSATTPAFGH